MRIDTTRFGVVEIDDSSIIRMPRGPLGFEDRTSYCLIQHRPDTSFRWLQSTEDPRLAFVVVDPSEFFSDYEIELTDADVERLSLESAEDAMVLVIATVAENGAEVTVNLLAPIVINSKNLVGMQVVLQDNRYSVKHPLATQSKGDCSQETADSHPAAQTKAA